MNAPTPVAVCGACGGALFANVFHICGANAHLHSEGKTPEQILSEIKSSYVEPPKPVSTDAGVFSEPPVVGVSSARTHCACGEALDPNVMHKCKANEEWRPLPQPPGSTDDSLSLVNAPHDSGSIAPMNVGVSVGEPFTEQQKYQAMWAHDAYRQVSPGQNVASEFLTVARPKNGAKIIDFGAGTGRGSLMIAILANAAGLDVDIEMLDFATNSLDQEVADLCHQDGTTKLRFRQHDLTQPVPVSAPFGYCTDVMEHIPPEQVDAVLTNVLQAAQHVFFQISCVDDSCGVLIGHPLHLSVHPPAWWKEKLEKLGCMIHFWRDDEVSCTAYVTAWSQGQDIVDAGVLNAELETIRSNVRTNIRAGWHQIKPHHLQSTEVMIVGGGPSLAGQLDTIRRMRFEGAKLVTLNGAYNWALEHGLEVSATVIVDARPHNARFTKPVSDKTIYLIGSQCDPTVLEGLPKERTLLWHTTAESIRDILQEECPDEWYGIQGGSTVLLRTIPLLRVLGYHRFHLFGCDSCLTDARYDHKTQTLLDVHIEHPNQLHHAYAQPENDDNPVIPVTVGGRVFQCHAWMCAQATEFITLIAKLGELFELQVHGDGLLSWIIQHGAQMDIDAEEARETASER